MRTNGILMPISSLPSDYGIGDFGRTSFEFIDMIKRAGIHFWQILPLNPLGGGNSPYSSICSFALDPIYIDLETLKNDGLIDDLKTINQKKKRVDYKLIRNYKEKLLRKAFLKQNDTNKDSFKRFIQNNEWVVNFAKYSILRKKNNFEIWWLWDKNERYDAYKHAIDYSSYKDEILFIEWCQFVSYKQYFKLKQYALHQGIKIMGDIPYYVGADSSDMWSNQDEFLLDENDMPTKVGGVPPDYFSETGQRWGNPCYDWEFMKEDNFTFWNARLKHALKMYDYLRIDHFRAFDEYYAIEPSCKTAIDGEWQKAYGELFFKEFLKNNSDVIIFAEDLGERSDTVDELIEKLNFPGMNVVQFTLLDSSFKEKQNQIIYTGTHDNDTLKGFIKKLSDSQKEELKIVLRQKNIPGRTLIDKVINYVLANEADYACIPYRDYLKFDSDSRINTPGTCGSPNWEFRIINYVDFYKIINKIKELLGKYKR